MSKSASKGMSGTAKFSVGVIFLLLIALGVVVVWKEIAVRGAESRFEEQRAQLAEDVRGALFTQTREMLELSAIPLSWSVRAEMIKENYEQIDDYLQRFVKEPNVKRVALVNHEGVIQIATDKKLEGQTASSAFPAGVLEVSRSTVIEPEGADEILAAVPIVSYDARLGTLVVVYSTAALHDKLPALAEPAPAADEQQEPASEPSE